MLRHSALLILVCVASLLPAAEADPAAEAKAVATAARALHAQAVKAGDLWTALQVESYARLRSDARPSRSALGQSTVIGDALAAFPLRVLDHWDLGDRVLVATSQRLYAMAADGRPLALSWAFVHDAEVAALAPGGGFVGIVQRPGGPPRLRLSVQAAGDGKKVFEQSVPRDPADVLNGGVAVAWDGSAAAGALRHDLLGAPRLFLASAEGIRAIPGLRWAQAVGPKAVWVIANQVDENQLVLVRGDARTHLRSFAVGHGLAAVVTPSPPAPPAVPGTAPRPAPAPQLQLLRADGQLQALPWPVQRDVQVATLGAWLVVINARGPQDPLADPGVAPRPVCALYRWADLVAAKDPAAVAPAGMIEGPWSPARAEAAAAYLWRGNEVQIVDVSGAEPQLRSHVMAPAPVASADEQNHRTRVHGTDGSWLVCDRQGRELWSGMASDLAVQDRDWALLRYGPRESATFAVVRLALKPEQRRRVDLDLTPGPWVVDIDRLERFITAELSGQHWFEIDPASARTRRQVPSGDLKQLKPRANRGAEGQGRFYRREGRLFDKSDGENVDEPRRLSPEDAWFAGGTLVVLSHDGRVLSSRKRGVFDLIGRIFGADRLGLLKDQPVVLNRDAMVLAGFGPGPQIQASLTPLPGGTNLPAGPWRVNGRSFTAPGLPTLAWDDDRCGFAPERLRSPETGDMLAITRSLIIVLDRDAARLVAVQPGK